MGSARGSLEFLQRAAHEVGGIDGGQQIVQPIVGHDGAEAVRVTLHPVGHVPAITGAGGGDTRRIHIRPGKRCINRLHLVLIRSAAPLSLDRVHELEPEARGTVKVGFDDHVTGRREYLRVPAIVELVVPCCLRPAVHEQ